MKSALSVIECFLIGAMSPVAESTDPCRCMKEPAKYSLRLNLRPELVASGEARELSLESVETVRVRVLRRGGFHKTSVL